MRKVKLSVVLPVVFCGIEGVLWYWDAHSQPWVPSPFFGKVSPASPISTGLDFPATLWTSFTTMLLTNLLSPSIAATPSRLASLLSRLIVGTPAQTYFLLCVAVCWYLIGRRLETRASGKVELKRGGQRIWGVVSQFLILVLGVFTLLLSLHLPIRNFFFTIERALVQTWAVFLIGVPVSGLAHSLLIRSGRGQLTGPGGRARQPFSNFRLFVIVLGTFAALLMIGVLTGPAGPK